MKKQEKKRSQVFGLNIGRQLGYYDQDLRLLKMSGLWLNEAWRPSLQTLSKSGCLVNGRIYEQKTWMHRIEGKGFGLLATPTQDSASGRKKKYKQGGIPLTVAIQKWPTPTSTERSGINPKTGRGQGLSKTVKTIWPTPTTQENAHPNAEITRTGRRKSKNGKDSHGLNLADAVKMTLPTPQASDYITKKTSKSWKDQGSVNYCLSNPEIQHKWPTPRASEWKGVGPLGSKSHKHMSEKEYLCAKVQDREQMSGQLNPQFVSWLMGYPLAWTDTRADLQLSLTKERIKSRA